MERVGRITTTVDMYGFLIFIRQGMMEAAMELFAKQFEWEELPDNRVRSVPCRKGGATLQLLERKSLDDPTFSATEQAWILFPNRLGETSIRPVFKSFWSKRTAQAVQEWAKAHEMECVVAEIPEDGWIVYIPRIFHFGMEFLNI